MLGKEGLIFSGREGREAHQFVLILKVLSTKSRGEVLFLGSGGSSLGGLNELFALVLGQFFVVFVNDFGILN